MSEVTKITEEMGVHKEWKTQAKEQTVETIGEFVRHLAEDYDHDYGTIVHAITSAMIAVGTAIDRSKQGGITGFQASCIPWPIIREYMGVKGESGARIVNYDDLLYPQHEHKFNQISQDCWDKIQFRAQENLKDKPDAHPNVRAHWESLVEGKIPFGFTLEPVEEPVKA